MLGGIWENFKLTVTTKSPKLEQPALFSILLNILCLWEMVFMLFVLQRISHWLLRFRATPQLSLTYNFGNFDKTTNEVLKRNGEIWRWEQSDDTDHTTRVNMIRGMPRYSSLIAHSKYGNQLLG
ncbi:hypothetical protein C8J56DRAFT_879612 [Mycena floridula]|nr:hypothetical protein C8J56DRAFT_879612 [Mycena floridula]